MQAWFFIDDFIADEYFLKGEHADHAKKSLRMKIGEEIILCDKEGYCHRTVISEFLYDSIHLITKEKFLCQNEPNIKIKLFQALTKGDKMELIIQKAVELGVSEIVPIISNRCVSRPDKKSMTSKIIRWQKIALQAAMQSRRGIVPKINPPINLKDIKDYLYDDDFSLVFYEKFGRSLKQSVSPDFKKGSIIVGCEGGFDPEEIDFLNSIGVSNATLGPRILRTETAPLMALSIIMYITNNI